MILRDDAEVAWKVVATAAFVPRYTASSPGRFGTVENSHRVVRRERRGEHVCDLQHSRRVGTVDSDDETTGSMDGRRGPGRG